MDSVEFTEKSDIPKHSDEEQKEEEWQDLLGSGAILKKILREGDPNKKPDRYPKCVINYTCSLEDGTEVDRGDNLEIIIGEYDVVQGLDVAVSLMHVNEICLLKIEPRLAFGVYGLPPKIPTNSIVQYVVELLAVDFVDNIEKMTVAQRKLMGNKKRQRGNWWYGRGENNLAIDCYLKALKYLDEVEGATSDPSMTNDTEVTDADLQSLLEDRVSVCNNMAAAQIKMEQYDAALNSLQSVLRCQPNNLKALFRKAKVYTAKNDLISALSSLQKAKKLYPNDVDIQRQMNIVTQLMDKQKESERELARRMFNGPKNKLETVKKPEMGNLRMWAAVGASVVVGLAGMVAYRFKYS